MDGKRRILLFNVNWIGDTVFSTAAIRNLRRNFPGAFLACVIPPRCLPVLQGNPFLDEVIVFDEKGRHKGVAGKIAFIAGLRKRRFDTAYLLHRSMTRALICALARIPQRIGYATAKRSFLLTRKIPAPDMFSVHRAEYYLGLLRRDGLAVDDIHADFAVSPQEREKAVSLLEGFCREGDFVVAINPGGNWMPKRWPKENWTALARRLTREFSARVVISGGPEDAVLAEEIREASGVPLRSICGLCGLKEFAAVAALSSLFITADSGPLHIADAAGARRIIALFGPTDPKLTGPAGGRAVILRRDVGCRIPCYVEGCADNRCMKAITVDDVIAQVRKIYGERKG